MSLKRNIQTILRRAIAENKKEDWHLFSDLLIANFHQEFSYKWIYKINKSKLGKSYRQAIYA
jgi:hypothetical protein